MLSPGVKVFVVWYKNNILKVQLIKVWFIRQYTNAVIVVTELEAWITMALVRSICINTRAIVADVGMTNALIYIKAWVSCWW
jgi:hypothetical protein